MKEATVKFTKDDVSQPRTIDVDIHEHEIMLVFSGDDQAVAFDEWLTTVGMDLFVAWVKTYKPL